MTTPVPDADTCTDLDCPHHGHRNTATYGLTLVAYNWLDTKTGHTLHHAQLTPEQAGRLIDDCGLWEPIRLTCGRVVQFCCIPGLFARMGVDRCSTCCSRLGYPQGKGSPKNDDRIRHIVGLPADRDTPTRAAGGT